MERYGHLIRVLGGVAQKLEDFRLLPILRFRLARFPTEGRIAIALGHGQLGRGQREAP